MMTMIILESEAAETLLYVLACVDTHADKFPVPSHMRTHVAKIRKAVESSQKHDLRPL